MDSQLKWSDQQRRAISLVESGRNVLVTGFAGTGKSTILNHLRDQIPHMSVTATTGVAAVNVKGSTLHSWARIGLGKDPVDRVVGKIRRNAKALKAIKKVKTLAIDEVSMLSANLMDYLDCILRGVRSSNDPFGGIQLVLFGDFLQLPPVKIEKDGGWAFDSMVWSEANIATCLLSQCFRQEEQAFIDILALVRDGQVTDEVSAFLNERKDDSGLTGHPVSVFSHNRDVDDRNERELEKLTSKKRTYEASYTGQGHGIRALEKNVMAPDYLELRPGARVMLLRNMSVSKGLVNGSTGTVKRCRNQVVDVSFDCGSYEEIEPHKWDHIDGSGQRVASKSQIPLKLAYAATAHKCQGMQFDNMEVDLSQCFSPGQAYVALSRAKRPEGLVVTSWSEASIFADERAKEFYENIDEGELAPKPAKKQSTNRLLRV